VDTPVDFAPEQAGGFENTQMFGDRGKRDVERRRQFANGGFALREAGENRTARGIGKRAEGGVEHCCGGGRIVNHMV
jgi:hypothetical protein